MDNKKDEKEFEITWPNGSKATFKIRKCRQCSVDLPPTNYFHCNPCKAKIESEEGSDDFS